MEKVHYLTEKDGIYPILPPGRYICYGCKKHETLVFYSGGQEVKPCPKCGSTVVFEM